MCEKPNKWIVCISYTFNDTLSRADLINKYWTKLTQNYEKARYFIYCAHFFIVIKRSSLQNYSQIV